MRFKILTVVVMMIALGIIAIPAQAQSDATPETPQLGISPVDADGTYFTLEMEPGETRELAVELNNFGTEPQEVRTYAANVLTMVNGGFDIALHGAPIGGTTEWLNYPTEILELAPNSSTLRPFTLTVPDDAVPGEYLSGIAIETAEARQVGGTPEAGSVGFEQVLRQAIAVFITIPGDAEANVEIGPAIYRDLTAAPAVQVEVENTGRLRINPGVEFVLTRADGTEVTSASFEMDAFYPDTATLVQVALVQPLEAGDYVVSLSLRDEDPELDITADSIPLTVQTPEGSGTPAPEVIAIESVAVTETRGTDDALQAVEIVTTIDNGGPAVSGAQLTLTVERDGELVEEYVLGSSLSFPQGPAEFRQRYVPLDGWEPGTYTFTVTLEGTDPNTGELVELSTVESEMTVTAP